MDDPWSRRTPPPSVEVRQEDDGDGALRLTLVGEIDMAAADYLTTQIAHLTRARRPVRLDLSQLRFTTAAGWTRSCERSWRRATQDASSRLSRGSARASNGFSASEGTPRSSGAQS